MLQPGQIIQDKYRIVRLIGQGGMGEVYEGENLSIARRVAIKVLIGEAATNADVVQRFQREAQAAGRIGNDHILDVLDLGSLPGGDRFMVMEFLDGEPLNARIERLRQLTADQAIPLVLQALAGLSAAHQAGIIHRDLKPENLFVLKQKAGVPDYVKIIDFGISKFNQLTSEGMKMTRTGSVMGTPYYMSPEQANGSREADARSDLYTMGVILYECVTGTVPFQGKTFNELLFKIVLSDPPAPRQLAPGLDPALEAIILKAMAREAGERFQTCEDFTQALRNYQAAATGVPVPDRTGAVPAYQVAPTGAFSAANTAPSTGANWSKSDGDSPARSKAGVIAALVVCGIVVLGGVALAAAKIMHHSSVSAAASISAPIGIAAQPPPETPVAVGVVAAPGASAAAAVTVAPSPLATVAPAPIKPAEAKLATVKPVAAVAPGRPAARPAPAGKKATGGKAAAGAVTDFGY